MLTKQSIAAFGHILKYFTSYKIVPLHWNPTTFRLNELKSTWSLIPSYLVSIDLFVRIVFLMINYLYQIEFLSPFLQILQILWILTYSFAFVSSVFNNLKRNEFMRAVNHLLQLHEQLYLSAGPEPLSKNWGTKICEIALENWPRFIFFETFISSIDFIIFPSRPWRYYSILQSYENPWFIIQCFCHEFLDFILFLNSIMINVFVIMCYWLSMSCWLSQEVHFSQPGDGDDEPQTSSNTKIPIQLKCLKSVQLYKMFQLLNEEFNQCFSSSNLQAIQLAVIGFPIILLFLVIRYHDILPILLIIGLLSGTICCLLFATYVYPFAAVINTNSKSYLKSLAQMYDSVVIRKQIKSCPELKVKIGSYFYIQRFTGFVMIGMICYWTAKSLLLIKS